MRRSLAEGHVTRMWAEVADTRCENITEVLHLRAEHIVRFNILSCFKIFIVLPKISAIRARTRESFNNVQTSADKLDSYIRVNNKIKVKNSSLDATDKFCSSDKYRRSFFFALQFRQTERLFLI